MKRIECIHFTQQKALTSRANQVDLTIPSQRIAADAELTLAWGITSIPTGETS